MDINTILLSGTKRTYTIEYHSSIESPQIYFEASEGRVIKIGIGHRIFKSCISRNINLDLLKGLGYSERDQNLIYNFFNCSNCHEY